jgi:two-component system alkaline phosphatase synthesis response regulator PhoP
MSTQALQILAEPRAIHPPILTALPPPMPPPLPIVRSIVNFPCGVIDFDRSEIRYDTGERDELSVRETELLRYLAANADRAISRDEILQHVWHLDPRRLVTRTIDMHIANLREKLRDIPGDPKVIFTVRGCGYRFAPRNTR